MRCFLLQSCLLMTQYMQFKTITQKKVLHFSVVVTFFLRQNEIKQRQPSYFNKRLVQYMCLGVS